MSIRHRVGGAFQIVTLPYRKLSYILYVFVYHRNPKNHNVSEFIEFIVHDIYGIYGLFISLPALSGTDQMRAVERHQSLAAQNAANSGI